jgi:hypothetical protein
MDIPYGRSNFEEIRRGGYYYVDKTPFIPLLESAQAGYPLFLRPRRFGKSTLLSMLEHYYDIGRREQFDELFGGLWIHEHPTGERNRYLVLTLDFSGVAVDGGHESLGRSFLENVRESVHDWLFAYRELAPELDWLTDRIDGYESPEALIGGVLHAVRRSGKKLYVLVDEYDHFANRLLSGGEEGLYEESVVKRTGFIRTFYAKLKTGTRTGAIGRMFITGVTPLMLDDLSSGFNIVTPISTSARWNTLAGFTRAEVERAVDAFVAARPRLADNPAIGDRSRLLDVLEAYYDGYRFSPEATERVFNADMVLYFLRELDDRGQYPDDMLDQNVRTEYRHLQRIGRLSGTAATERREILETILAEGHIRSDLVRQFGVKSLSSSGPFISLLYYLGMLTLGEAPRDAVGYDLEIPNRVIQKLQWEHLALMLKEQAQIDLDVDDLKASLGVMAAEGDIAPFLDLFHSQVIKAFGVKDTRRLDEKTIKLLFMMYASLGHAFHPLSEKEFAQGYCDLFLGASRNVANARFSWLLEFKYLQANARPARIEAAFAEAEEQVGRYASDEQLLPILLDGRELRAGMIVFVGTKKALFRPWPTAPGARRPRGEAKVASPRARPARGRKRR